MMRTNSIFWTLAACLLLSGNSVADKTKNNLLRARRHQEEVDMCGLADQKKGYKFQQLGLAYLTNIDDVVTIAEDPGAWYDDMVAPFQSPDDITWSIEAGPRVTVVSGTEPIKSVFASLATRDFSFHGWTHWAVYECDNKKIIVDSRYHGVVREALPANNTDIFGYAELVFDSKERLLTHVTVVRTETVERPY